MVAAHFGVRFGRNWAILVSISVEIGLFWRLFQPESARIGLNWRESENEKKEKKKKTWHGLAVSGIMHCTLHRCTLGVGAAALEPHLYFLVTN